MRRTVTLLSAAILLATTAPMAVSAADPTAPSAAADELVVRYRTGTSAAERRALARELDLEVVRTGVAGRTQVVRAPGRSPATIRRLMADDPRVVAVAPNYQRELADEISGEEHFGSMWGLHNVGQTISGTRLQTGLADIDIDGLEALRITGGSSDVVVAVIDDGVDFSHPDLADRAWVNPGESGALATNGIDDDGNGFIDDVNGWDFCNDDASVHDAGEDGHGTHVAGTIAASLNGSGIVGVAPGVKVMAVKFIDDGALCGRDDMAIAAIDYAASFGIPIINASWGAPSRSVPLELAIADSGALFVAAAGNQGWNLEATPTASRANRFYPAQATLANILSVAAVDQRGALASFSNYGSVAVDITAPGTNILSTYPDNRYVWSDGTSMAAPHVAGVAALAASVMDGVPTASALKARVLGRGTALAAASGKTVTGRLVNAWRTLDVVGPTALPIDRHGINTGSIVGSTVSTTVVWPVATDAMSSVASYVVKRRVGSAGWTTVTNSTTSRSLKQTLTVGTHYRYGVAGRDVLGNVGAQADAPSVQARLFQEGTSLARSTGTWSTALSSSASGGKLRTTTRAGATVSFTTTARAIAVVGRKGPGRGQAKVYVDGAYVQTIDFNRSSLQSRVVVWSKSWSTPGIHTVKLVVVGTAGRPRVDIDAFAILR